MGGAAGAKEGLLMPGVYLLPLPDPVFSTKELPPDELFSEEEELSAGAYLTASILGFLAGLGSEN